MIAKYSGICRCGEPVAIGTTINYKGGIVGCPVCTPALTNGRTPTPPPRNPTPRPSSGAGPATSAPTTAAAVEVRVKIQAVKFAKPDGSWTIANVRPEGNLPAGSPIEDGVGFSVVGRLGSVTYGDLLDVKGVWEKNERFGYQLKVSMAVPVVAGTDAALLKFLQRFPAIGPAVAERILRHFGSKEAVVDILETNPGRLVEIPGITFERAKEISEAYNEAGAMKSVLMFIDGLGLSAGVIEQVIDAWGHEAVENIQDDPYVLTQFDGVGFTTADKVATKLGLSKTDPRRLAAATLALIEEAEDQGHTWSNMGDLLHL